MKKNSHTKLAERCAAKLHDPNWDKLLAERVEAARRSNARTRAALLIGALVFSVATVLSVATWSEEQHWTAILDETPYTVSGSFFSE